MICYKLLQAIEYWSKHNKLVLLRTANSEWQQRFIQNFFNGRTVINMADPILNEKAMWQPKEFLNSYNQPLLMLNFQHSCKLLPYLCSAENKHNCIAVASQNYYIIEENNNFAELSIFDLPLNISDSRIPFVPNNKMLGEYKEVGASIAEVFGKISLGDMRLSNNILSREQFYADYIQRFLQYDIKALTTVSDLMKFYKFMCAAAASVGGVVNYALLANAADVSSPTAKQWLKFLEGAGIIYFLYPMEHLGIKRLAKAPKMYFTDSGLAAYLLQLKNGDEIAASIFANKLFENWVVMQIRNSFLQNGYTPKFSYYRDSNAKEISLLIHYNDRIYPVDIKKEPFGANRFYKKIKLLSDVSGEIAKSISIGCVISICSDIQQLDNDLWLVPVSFI